MRSNTRDRPKCASRFTSKTTGSVARAGRRLRLQPEKALLARGALRLVGMRERTERIGGRFDIHSSPEPDRAVGGSAVRSAQPRNWDRIGT